MRESKTDHFLLALGGFIGFGGVFLVAFHAGGGDISGALLRASIGMIVGTFLAKMFISSAHNLHKQARMEHYKEMMKKKSETGEGGDNASN